VEILVSECSLYSDYSVQSSFSFGVGTSFPHLFFSTIHLMFITRFVVMKKELGLVCWTGHF